MSRLTGEMVQQMEIDLHASMIEVDSLRRSTALQEMELSHLRHRNVVLQAERDNALIKNAEMRTLMEQVSSGLVMGLSRMKFTERQRQERDLGVHSEKDPTPFQPESIEVTVPKEEPKVLSIDSRLPRVDFPGDDNNLRAMHKILGNKT